MTFAGATARLMMGKSSSLIVPVAVAVEMIAPLVGLERVTAKFSFGSIVVSPLTLTVITLEVSFAPKVTVPDGKIPPKSVTLAGLVPVAVTAQLTAFVSVIVPDRVTVKLKALLPEFPSV